MPIQMWERKWLVNFRTGKIRAYHVDFKTRQVNDPERWTEISYQHLIKDGFKSERLAKKFYEDYKDHYDKLAFV